MFYNLLAIFVGGGFGAVTRFLISYAVKSFVDISLYGTLTANLLGSFLIGYIFGITLNKIDILPTVIKLLITVGFVGGLTTFSTFSLESFELVKDGKIISATIYIIGSCIFSLVVVFAGYAIAIWKPPF